MCCDPKASRTRGSLALHRGKLGKSGRSHRQQQWKTPRRLSKAKILLQGKLSYPIARALVLRIILRPPSPKEPLPADEPEEPTVPPIAFIATPSARGEGTRPTGSALSTPRPRGQPVGSSSTSSPLTSPPTVRKASAKLEVQCIIPVHKKTPALRGKEALSDDEADARNAEVESRALVIYRKPPAAQVDHPTTPERRHIADQAHMSPIGDSDDSSEEPPPQRQYKDMFSEGDHARFLSRAPPGAVRGVEIRWQHLPRDLVPIIPLTTRVGEAPRGMYDTPQRKVFPARRPLITPGMDLEESQLYDVGLAAHEPCPDNPDGRPWVQQYDDVSHAEWRLGRPRANRFMQAPVVKSKQLSTSDAVVVRVQPPRKSTHNYHAQFDGEDLLEGAISMDDLASAEDDEFLPSPARRASGKRDDAEPTSATPRVDKGKAPERHARAGPSTGRPSFEVTEELERIGHKMQAEVTDLADKFGLSYETVLRKIGFARQQEVREPNLANIFRKVHKHRLAAASERKLILSSPMTDADLSTATQTAAQYNAAFTGWQEQHGDDPDAVAALLQEHANILASDTKTSRPSDIPKRVSVISQQMADMVSPMYSYTPHSPLIKSTVQFLFYDQQHCRCWRCHPSRRSSCCSNLCTQYGTASCARQWIRHRPGSCSPESQSPSPASPDPPRSDTALTISGRLQSAQAKQEQVETAMPNSRWIAGASPRDDYRLWVKGFLKQSFGESPSISAEPALISPECHDSQRDQPSGYVELQKIPPTSGGP